VSIDAKLLEIICCPESRQGLHLLGEEALNELNSLQSQNKLKHRNGESVSYSFTGALCREDKQLIYPIREDIPVLLVDEGIPVEQLEDKSFLNA